VIAVVLIVIILIAGLAVAYEEKWFPGQKSTSTTVGACSQGTTLQGNGAQFANPLVTAWASNYGSASGNQVNYVDGGSGTGLTDFSEHPPLIDFAVTDEPLAPAQVTAMPGAPLTLPIAGGALTIIYSLPGLSGHLDLSGAILANIYNGTVTAWNDPSIAAANPGVNLPSNTIVPVVRSDPAGTTYVLTQFLSDASTYWATHVGKGISVNFPHVGTETAVKGNSLVISTVSKTSYSIGYSDLTDVLSSSSPPQYAAIQNPAKSYIVPTILDTASAISDKVSSLTSIPASSNAGGWFNVSMVNANGSGDYPLATFVYLYVYQHSDVGLTPSQVRTQIIIQWIHYILSPTGQAMADESQPTQLYYAALPGSIVSVDQAGIQTMTFNGAGIPACN
jgi:phosphate transport system substrate-binding protein